MRVRLLHGVAAAARLSTLACVCFESVACSEPTVEALAVWLEESDASGRTELQVYERGERWSLPVVPNVPNVTPQFVAVATSGDGSALAVASNERLTIQGLDTQQRLTVTAAGLGVSEFVPQFNFTRSNSGILREVEHVEAQQVYIPLQSLGMLEPSLFSPSQAASPGTSWVVRTAASAPVLYWFERHDEQPQVAGRVEAVQLPGGELRGFPPVSRPTLRASTSLVGRPPRPGLGIVSSWCSYGVCAAPDGFSISTATSTSCTLQRWSWAAGEEARLETLELSDACPRSRSPALVAALDTSIFVLEDEDRVYYTDTSSGAWEARPKPSQLGAVLHMTDEGRSAVLVWPRGEVMRIDSTGIRLVSVEQNGCLLDSLQGTRVSPNGRWVLQTCNGLASEGDAGNALVVRISALGLEQHAGIAMRPLAIDDDGDALLYSHEITTGEPRGLFVLAADGQLVRIDDLEPQPVVIFESGAGWSWFSATALPAG